MIYRIRKKLACLIDPAYPRIEEGWNAISKEKQRLLQENEFLKKQMENYKNIFMNNSEKDFIQDRVGISKDNQPYIVFYKIQKAYKTDYSIDIIIKTSARIAILYATIDNNVMGIQDITMHEQYRNKGYGSAMMETLFKIAKDYDIQSISGKLSDVDFGHKDRLEHFYKKHGFNVSVWESGGTIYKNLIN